MPPFPEAVAARRHTRGLFLASVSARFQSLAAKLQSAPHSLHEFPGDFTFLHFQGNGDLFVARSIAGMVPLYLWHTPKRTALATRLDLLIRFHIRPVPFIPTSLLPAEALRLSIRNMRIMSR